MTDLRDELERIAERAPVVAVSSDLYARARRASARDRTVFLAAVVACLLVIVGLVASRPWAGATGPAPAGSHAEPRMPDRIWAVPEWMTAQDNDGHWSRQQVSDDLGVGVAAAAYLRSGLPVVVSALDGSYHLLDLPDFVGNRWAIVVGLYGDSLGFTLSPDGTQLAYSYARFGDEPTSGTTSTGIRVLDLTTGAIREIPLPGGAGVIATRVRWSPAGTWLAWSGYRTTSWMANGSMTGGSPVTGLIGPEATTSTPLPAVDTHLSGSDLAVDDAGRVTLLTSGRIRRTGPAGASPRPLDPRARVGARGVLRTAESARKAVAADPDVTQLTLATDLLAAPTVSRPAPRWPWSPDRWAITVASGGAALVVVACAGGLVVLRRRRRFAKVSR